MTNFKFSIIYVLLTGISVYLIFLLFNFLIINYIDDLFEFIKSSSLLLLIFALILGFSFFPINERFLKDIFSILPKTLEESYSKLGFYVEDWTTIPVFIFPLGNTIYLIYLTTVNVPVWNFWNIFFYILLLGIIGMSHAGFMPKDEKKY